MRNLTLGLGIGVVTGVAMATMAINSLYPDVPKRIMRDGRRAVRSTKRTLNHIMG